MYLVCQMFALCVFLVGSSTSAFFIKWPWPFVFPGTSAATTTTLGAASINYGFLRPTIILPVTTAAPTTTTTTTTTTPRPTTPLSQLLINAFLGSAVNIPASANNSLLISLANALANRPTIGGIAQPYPGGLVGGASGIIAPGGFGGIASPGGFGGIASPGGFGGIASPGGFGGIASPGGFGGIAPPFGGIAAPPSLGGVGGGFVLPSGFPAAGGVISSGVLPGFLPGGIIGRSSKGGKGSDSSGSSGKVIFDSSRKRK